MKTGALRPRGSGGSHQGTGGVGAGGWEPTGTLVAFGTASSLVTKMASQSQGIQQLLQAEKRAAEKVADARKRKARRLKQAKEEAQMEVEQYRREREQEFQSKQQAVSCGESRDGLTPVQIMGASCKMYVGDSTRS